MEPSDMWQVEDVQGVRILKITGEFTSNTAPDFQKICTHIGEEPDTKGVLFDLEGVTAIDTSAFACMVDFVRKHKRDNIKIGIIHLTKIEKELLEILRLVGFIKTFKTREEAIASLSGQ